MMILLSIVRVDAAMKAILPKKQKGAAAIEFALVFVIFFAVLYGVVSYSLPLLLVQSFNNATAEAARRGMAVALEPATGYEAALKKEVEDTLKTKLAWVPAAVRSDMLVSSTYNPQTKELIAKVTLPAAALAAIMPVLKLGAITVPSLPTDLAAESSVKLGQ